MILQNTGRDKVAASFPALTTHVRSETIMATRHSTAPARAGERSRSPSTHYNRAKPPLEVDEAAPGTVGAWEAIAPIRPDTAHVRAPRFLDLAGELLAATFIIAGGVFAYGYLALA